MIYLNKILWVLTIVVLAAFGVTLSWSILAVSVLCMALVGLAAGGAGLAKGRHFQRVDYLLVLTLAYFAWRAYHSTVWDLAKEDLMLMAGGVLAYLLIRLGRSANLSRATVVVLSACVVVNAVVYSIQQAGETVWLPLDLVDEFTSQAASFGLFQDYGALGNAMAVIGVVLFSFALTAQNVGMRLRWIVGFIGILALVLVYLSGSRSAVISVAVAGGVMLPILWLRTTVLEKPLRKRARVLLVAGACCAAVLAASLSLMTFAERDGKALQTGVAAKSNIRQGYWGMAVDQWQESPVIGQGARAYSYKSNELWEGAMGSNDASPEFVHNEYLQTLADYGIVGLALLIALLGTHWFVALRSLLLEEQATRRSWLRLAGLLGLTVVMVHSFTDFPLRLPFNMFLAAVCLAWCVSRKRKEEKGKSVECGVRSVKCLDDLSAVALAKEGGERLKGDEDRGERLKEKGLDDGTGEGIRSYELGIKNANVMKQVRDKGMAVVLMLFSATVAVFAGREVWAAAPLLVEKQAREGGAWSPVGHEKLLEAYTLANERSPDFRRSQRIGQIYHQIYLEGKEETFEKAASFYKESILRNPSNPTTQVNLAKLYQSAGMLEASDRQYQNAESSASARDGYFKFYLSWAENEQARAMRSYENKQLELTDEYLVRAISIARKGASRLLDRYRLSCDCSVARVRVAVESAKYDNALSLWHEVEQDYKHRIAREGGEYIYRSLAEVYLVAANKEWKARNPELAKELYLQSRRFFLKDRKRMGNNHDEFRQKKVNFIDEALKIFETAGF